MGRENGRGCVRGMAVQRILVMSFVVGLLTSRLAGPIAAGLCVLLLLFGLSQCSGRVKAERARDHADKLLARSVADLSVCKGNVVSLDAALGRQNAAVAALGRESEARAAESRKAVSAARSVAESYRKSAAAILGARPKGADACSSADALIAEVVR